MITILYLVLHEGVPLKINLYRNYFREEPAHIYRDADINLIEKENNLDKRVRVSSNWYVYPSLWGKKVVELLVARLYSSRQIDLDRFSKLLK